MSTINFLKLFFITLLIMALSISTYAQDSASIRKSPGNTQSWLEIIQTGTWQELDQAFKDIPVSNEPINRALIQRLEFENNRFVDEIKKNPDTEAYGEFYISLIDRVAKIDSDLIIDPLIKSLDYIGGVTIPDTLVKRASAALPRLIKDFDTAGTDLKRRILFTFERMAFYHVDLGNLSANLKPKLQTLLQKSLEDQNPMIRKRALHAVIAQKDSVYLPLLEKIASSDPYFVYVGNKEGENGTKIYPLRELAQKRLATR